jgi:hypothetical protein
MFLISPFNICFKIAVCNIYLEAVWEYAMTKKVHETGNQPTGT